MKKGLLFLSLGSRFLVLFQKLLGRGLVLRFRLAKVVSLLVGSFGCHFLVVVVCGAEDGLRVLFANGRPRLFDWNFKVVLA